MPAWSYARQTIFNPRSRACFWKHPWQAGRMVLGAGVNRLLDLDDPAGSYLPELPPRCTTAQADSGDVAGCVLIAYADPSTTG